VPLNEDVQLTLKEECDEIQLKNYFLMMSIYFVIIDDNIVDICYFQENLNQKKLIGLNGDFFIFQIFVFA
jgi:hypothetical protein